MSSPGRRGQRPIISAGTAEEAIALATSWVAGAAPKPTQAQSSDGDTAIEMVYSVLGAVGPRAVTAPVALSLGNGGSHP